MEEEKARYFASDGISDGTSWATYTRKANGSLRRVCSSALPLRSTRQEAERDLAVWLRKKFPAPQEPANLEQVINHLNQAIGTTFRPDSKQAGYIAQRLREGYTVEDLKAIIDLKVRQWLNDKKMRTYLRPSTLFNREKCEAYHQEVKRNGDPKNPYRRGHGEPDWERDPDQL